MLFEYIVLNSILGSGAHPKPVPNPKFSIFVSPNSLTTITFFDIQLINLILSPAQENPEHILS